MHSPEQAAKLWCPMMRIALSPAKGGPGGITDAIPAKGYCGLSGVHTTF